MALTAIVFPGQGSQTPDMRETVERHRPDLLDQVTEAVGADPFALADSGTRFAQPAIFCASLAGWEALGRPQGDLLAGHSLGELGALVAAGALAESDALELVALRGRLMQEAGETAGDGGMLALLGRGAADHAASLADAHGLAVANDNSPQQVVLSGAREALPAAAADAEEVGLRAMIAAGHRRVPLADDGLRRARVRGRARPRGALRSRQCPCSQRLRLRRSTTFARGSSRRSTSPVRWRETLLTMRDLGAERFVEVGPGRVLTGLAKRTLTDVELVNA